MGSNGFAANHSEMTLPRVHPQDTAVLPPDDEHLIERIRLRDAGALELLHQQYHQRAFAVAYSVVSDPGAAEEVIQDAFLSVWRYSATYNPRLGRVRPWLMSIVERRAIDHLRHRRMRPPQVELQEAWMTPSTTDVFADAFASVQRQQIWSGVCQLPETQRVVIEELYYHGRTFAEIAEMTAAPVGTVKSRARLGMRKLRRLLSTVGARNGGTRARNGHVGEATKD